jgi:hypothetical protein
MGHRLDGWVVWRLARQHTTQKYLGYMSLPRLRQHHPLHEAHDRPAQWGGCQGICIKLSVYSFREYGGFVVVV